MSLRTTEKKQRRYYSGKKKQHTQKAQVIADLTEGKIVATAFCEGKTHDFALFKKSKTALLVSIAALTDSGYQGINKLHANSETPKKKSKKHPLTDEEKAVNRDISLRRIGCEHVIGRL